MISDTPQGRALHPQLARDGVAIGDLALSRLPLSNDANYSRLILLPRERGCRGGGASRPGPR